MSENPFFKANALEMLRRSVEETRRLIRHTYEAGQKTGARHVMGPLMTDNGEVAERIVEAMPGQIRIERSRDDDALIQTVETDRGLIAVGKHAEIMTKEIAACQAVFVRGKTADGDMLTGMFHLTPSSHLPWGNHKDEDNDKKFGHKFRRGTVEKIVTALQRTQANPISCTVFLIRNAGGPPEAKFYWGYDEQHLEQKTHDLASLFTASGYATHVVEPLPLQSTTLYWSSGAPGEMYAIGERLMPDPKGGFVELSKDQRGVEEKIFSLNVS